MKKQLKRMAYLGSFYSVGSILQNSLSFLFIPIYTSYLTPEDYGIIGLVTISIAWIERFVVSPVGNGITRHYHAPEHQGRQKEMVFSSFLFVLVQTVVLTAIFFLASKPLAGLLFGDHSLEHITRAFAFALLVKPNGRLMITLLRIQGRAKLYTIVNLCRFILAALLQIYLLVWQDMGLMAMVYASIFSAWFNVVVMGPYIVKQIRFKFEWALLKPVLHYGYPLIVAALIGSLASSADRFVLRIYGSLSMVGLYSFGYSIAGIVVMFLSTPLKQAFLPVVFEMEKDPENQRDFVKRSCTYVYMLGVMLCLLVSAFAKDAIMILARNPEFWVAWTIVPLLAFSKVQEAMRSYFSNGMAMAKKSMLISATSVIKGVINIAFLFILVPVIGLLGSALAVVVAGVALNVIRAYYSRKLYNQEFEVARLLKVTLIGAGVFAAALVIILLDLPMWAGIPLKLIIIAVFPLLLWVLRVLNEVERGRIRTLFNRYRSQGVLEIARSVASIYRG